MSRRNWKTKGMEMFGRLTRLRNPDRRHGEGEEDRLAEVLETFDLISLGTGSCIGTGIYIIAGEVARRIAGPAVVLSFLFAGLASILSGVCYAEFGVRVPKTTGSAYMYSYVTVGEFTAFVIGWNLVLEYLIGTSASASALAGAIDAIFDFRISTLIAPSGVYHIHTSGVVALIIGIITTLIIAAGVKKSVNFNNALNVVNFAVWIFIIAGGVFFAKAENWSFHGFMPYGFSGVMAGAATCFYAFIGFDIIATTGEEATNPTKSIPIAIISSLVICLTAYCSVSVILTLAVPYPEIGVLSPLMKMFVQNNASAGQYVVACGAVAGLTVSLLGSLFPMPRIIYAMATDGLLFKFLGRVNPWTHTPAWATIISGFLAALLALLVSLDDLIEMMSIGTLLAYTLVSMSVLILRYQPHRDPQKTSYDKVDKDIEEAIPLKKSDEAETAEPLATLQEEGDSKLLGEDTAQLTKASYGAVEEPEEDQFKHDSKRSQLKSLVRRVLRLSDPNEIPTPETGRMVTIYTLCLFIINFCLNATVIFGHEYVSDWWCIIIIVTFVLAAVFCIWNVARRPQDPIKLKFMAPCVPALPMTAMFVNIFLMLKLSYLTWIRFGVWMVIGLAIYFGYGAWNSNLETGQTTKEMEDEKEAIVMDSKKDAMPTSDSVAQEKDGASADLPPPGAPAVEAK